MNLANILTLTFFSIFILIIIFLFYLRWSKTKILIKSNFTYLKVNWKQFIFFSVFLSFIISISMGTIGSVFSYQDNIDTIMKNNGSTINIYTNNLYLSKSSNSNYERELNKSYDIPWASCLIYDKWDDVTDCSYITDKRDKLIKNDLLSDVDIINNQNINDKSNWEVDFEIPFYNIDNNEYIYAIEYLLASYKYDLKKNYEDNKIDQITYDNLNIDFSFTTTLRLGANETGGDNQFDFFVDGVEGEPFNNNTFDNLNYIEIVSVPNISKANTNQEGVLVDQFEPLNSLYNELNNDFAYVVSSKHDNFKVKKDSVINIETSNGNDNLSYQLKVKDIGYSSNYLYNISKIYEKTASRSSPETMNNTDTLFLFVNSDTLYNIMKTFLYDSSKGWDELTYNNYLSEEDFSAITSSRTSVSYSFNISSNYIHSLLNQYNFNGLNTERQNIIEGETINGISNYIYDQSYNMLASDQPSYFISLFLQGDDYNENNIENANGVYYLKTFIEDEDSVQLIYNYAIPNNYRAIKGNWNYITPSSYYYTYYSSLNIFIIAFIFMALVLSLIILFKNINKSRKELGTLSAIGFSRLSIALSFSFTSFTYFIFAAILSLAFYPLISIFWSITMSNSISIPIALFSLSMPTVIYGWVLPFILFILFTFIVSLIFISFENPISLIKNKKTYTLNTFQEKLISINKKSNISFNNRMVLENSLTVTKKSFLVIFSTTAISFFILLTFATSTIVRNTTNNALKSMNFTSYGAFGGNIVGDNFYDIKLWNHYTIEEYNELIDNGTIKAYDFGISKSIDDNVDWSNSATYYDNIKKYVLEYIETTPIKNTYLPENYYYYIIENIISNNPNTIDSLTPDEKILFDSFCNFFNKLDYAKFDLNPNTKNDKYSGIAIGSTITDDSQSLMYLNKTELVYSNEKETENLTNSDIWINIGNTEYFEKTYDLNSKNTKQLEELNDYSTYLDGKVYFKIKNEPAVYDIFNYINNNQPLVEGETSFTIKLPYNFYNYDSNENGQIDANVEGIEFIYAGTYNIPSPSGIIFNSDDPDFVTPYSEDLSNPNVSKYDPYGNKVTHYGIKGDIVSSFLDDSYSNLMTTYSNFNNLDNSNINSDELKNLFELFGKSKSEVPYISTSFNLSESNQFISNDSDFDKEGTTIKYDSKKNSINDIFNDEDWLNASIDIYSNYYNEEKIDNFTFQYVIENSGSYTIYDKEQENYIVYSLANNIDSVYLYSDSNHLVLENILLTLTQNNSSLQENIIENWNDILEKLDITNNYSYDSFTLDISQIYISIMTPGAQSYQDTIINFSIFAISIIIVLLFITINDIVEDNKKNTNILKIMGYKPNKIIYTNYSFYSLFFIIGFFVSILFFAIISLIVSLVAGSAGTLFPILLSVTPIQTFISFAFIIIIFISMILLIYNKILNTKPNVKNI